MKIRVTYKSGASVEVDYNSNLEMVADLAQRVCDNETEQNVSWFEVIP